VYRDLGRYDVAINAYQRAMELEPQWAAPFAGIGSVYRDLGRYDEASVAYIHAVELDPLNAYSYIGLGDMYVKMSRTNDAVASYQRAIELEPKNARYRTSIAGFYRKLGKAPEYIEQIKIIRELIVQEDEYNRASFESVCGNVDQALELLKAAIEKKSITKAWARRDPDFDFIRDDPRFKALVGE
jgi:tetratricopeptide (TPR) repeat protein